MTTLRLTPLTVNQATGQPSFGMAEPTKPLAPAVDFFTASYAGPQRFSRVVVRHQSGVEDILLLIAPDHEALRFERIYNDLNQVPGREAIAQQYRKASIDSLRYCFAG